MDTTRLHTDEAQVSDVAAREEEVLTFWREHDIFHKSLKHDDSREDFVFYDGPPFATGLPHYGHILAGTIKDTIPRFWTMNGYRVQRQWGWDCHGLPLENIIEKRLGLATKRDIEALGIKKFNEAARDAVLEYADDWKRIIPRMGRFVDMEEDYKTMDPSYTESVWWVFAKLHEKGLVYEGFKSMHLCPRCGTTLSNFEVNQGYKDIKDIAVTVTLPLLDEAGDPTDTSLLVWTTTPWTLPGNMAAAVHRDVVYAKVKVEDEYVILAKARVASVFGDTPYEIVEEIKGRDLVGQAYAPPFDYWQRQDFDKKENAWKIYHADYVEVGEEGTGAVHLAPAYGEEDMELAKAEGIPIVHHVDTDGRFKDFVTDFAGHLVKPKDDDDAEVSHLDADIEIVKALKDSERLFKKENITHSYPHCWRCDTPLLNYATTSWFVKVTDIREQLVAENERVHWVPEHVGKNRFGKWLQNARDWAVSRQRYWGAPLPIWKNQKTNEYHVFGSLQNLQEYVPKSGNTYYVMRHGEAEHNTQNTFSSDPEKKYALTEKGTEQSLRRGRELRKHGITKIYSSPFHRCMETARLVAEEVGIDPSAIITDPRLGEINFGIYSGRSPEEYHAWEERTGDWFIDAPQEGESQKEVKRRFGEFLYAIESEHASENILIVTHSIGVKSLQMVAQGANDDLSKSMAEAHTETGHLSELPFVPFPHNEHYELDFHRPYIDEFALYDGDVRLERVPDVFDCWFESGAMPYGQNHYPFENFDTFDPEKGKGYPANFIAESIDQTRGWFYSLIVLGVALFEQSPYKNVITNGLVLAEDGRKMSKSLQNYPDPLELAARVGVDSIRYYLLSSPIIRGEDLNFSEKEVAELQRKNIGRLHNVLALYELYAGDEEPICDSANVLDRWIVARLNQLVGESTDGFQNYELDRATRPIAEFIDDLSVWYIRRSRDRMKGDDVKDKEAALGTLRHVLNTLALVMAPSMPFYADYLYARVKEDTDPESVHLASWPQKNAIDPAVLDAMKTVRELVTIALEARAKAGIKVRQPLSSLTVNRNIAAEYAAVIADEINVKEIISDAALADRAVLDTTITQELKQEGDARELIRAIQDLRKQANLEPSDRITLIIQTSDGGEAVVRTFEESIKRTVGADRLIFADADGSEVVAGDHSYTISLERSE